MLLCFIRITSGFYTRIYTEQRATIKPRIQLNRTFTFLNITLLLIIAHFIILRKQKKSVELNQAGCRNFENQYVLFLIKKSHPHFVQCNEKKNRFLKLIFSTFSSDNLPPVRGRQIKWSRTKMAEVFCFTFG